LTKLKTQQENWSRNLKLRRCR